MGVTNFPDGINVGSSGGSTATLQVGGTVLNLSATELNYLDGALGKVLSYDSATPHIVAAGSTALTAGGTVATGLGGTPLYVTATLQSAGTGNFAVSAQGTAGGSVIFTCYNSSAAAATTEATVNWIAVGTAA